MGANAWEPEYNEFLRDEDVVLLQDNDEEGRKHVQNVAQHLSGIARRIRVLLLPGLGAKRRYL